MFQTVQAPGYSEPAPDGSKVFPLVRTEQASAGLIHLGPGQTTIAVMHRTIEEIWYVLDGAGELWRSTDGQEEVVALEPDTCVTIPARASFQFRANDGGDLRMLMVTVPPWPGPEEVDLVDGRWEPASP
jgi:mannose-6-phosphate isomerase-like protein (cupin superfamily)